MVCWGRIVIAPIKILRDDPRIDWDEGSVEFRLTYQGALLSHNDRDARGAVRAPSINKKYEKYSIIS